MVATPALLPRKNPPNPAGFDSYEEYHPYGSTAWWAGDSALVGQKRYKYTGMERDEETGLQCHGRRYYATWLGRWTSADPIGLGDGGNRFGYCHASPATLSDTTGLTDAPLDGEVEYGAASEAFLVAAASEFIGLRDAAGLTTGDSALDSVHAFANGDEKQRAVVAQWIARLDEMKMTVAGYAELERSLDARVEVANDAYLVSVDGAGELLVPSQAHSTFFLLDMRRLLDGTIRTPAQHWWSADVPVIDTLVGAQGVVEARTQGRSDWSLLLEQSGQGSWLHFLESSPVRRHMADTKALQADIDAAENATDPNEQKRLLMSVLPNVQWRTDRGWDLWKAWEHEHYGHPYALAETHSTDPGTQEKKMVNFDESRFGFRRGNY